ncbi:hypothetical protein J6590_035100 [Homalodisca vitripennis]|nr:hypothetical protein J6590_035100 [Homalodisca vitripennis]
MKTSALNQWCYRAAGVLTNVKHEKKANYLSDSQQQTLIARGYQLGSEPPLAAWRCAHIRIRLHVKYTWFYTEYCKNSKFLRVQALSTRTFQKHHNPHNY